MDLGYSALLHPTKYWMRAEIISNPSPIPRSPGVYAWYFRETPPETPTEGCHICDDLTLLYVGISPKAPPHNGRTPSKQTLQERLRQHLRGNAAGSGLRLSLGCLLSERLGIKLRRVRAVGSAKKIDDSYRYTFTTSGEAILNEWLARNAFVTWMLDNEPWKKEEELIRTLSLPLNLDQNNRHAFHSVLTAKRKAAKERAEVLPVVWE